MYLKDNKCIPKDSKLFELNPLLSQERLLLVQDRLQKTTMQFSVKHLIVIHSMNKLSELIVRDAHQKENIRHFRTNL